MYYYGDNRVSNSISSVENWSLKDSCSEIKVSSKVYSKASKRSTRSD